MPEKKGKKGIRSKTLATWALALISFSAASLAGVFALTLSVRALPAAEQPAAAPAVSLSPEATAVLKATSMADPSDTPAPSPSPLPTPAQPTIAPTATASAAPGPTAGAVPKSHTGPIKVRERAMPIGALLDRLDDRPVDAYGTVGLVKRGGVSYYAWAQDLYLYDGKATARILQNISCGWMIEDEKQNLWFSIRGGSGIDTGQVREFDSVYRYDRVRKSFDLMLSEDADRSLADGYGIVTAGSCFFYVDGGSLMAFDTRSGMASRIGAVCPNAEIRPAEGADAIYYQNASRQYVLLSDPGENGQTSAVLDMRKYPGGRFACSPYVLDDGFALYENRLTGYVAACRLKGVPEGASPDGGARIVPVAGGFGIPGAEAAYVDVFNLGSKAWRRYGNPARECGYCAAGEDGRFWFLDWKPAALITAGSGGYAEYDLSGAMSGCAWAGITNSVIFLSEYDLYGGFTHVFMADTLEFYEITHPPLPGDRTGG